MRSWYKKVYLVILFCILLISIYVLWSVSPSASKSDLIPAISSTGSKDGSRHLDISHDITESSTTPKLALTFATTTQGLAFRTSIDPHEKWAYVFHAPNEAHLCSALINIDRLFNDLKIKDNIDVVLFVNSKSGDEKVCTQECFPEGRLHLAIMINSSTDNERAFERFRIFGMTEYARVISIDTNGVIMRNLDHLFTLDFQGHDIATTILKHQGTEILTTRIMVIKPSDDSYDKISKFEDPWKVDEAISEVEMDPIFSNTSDSDMLLNHMGSKNMTKIKRLPLNYAISDSHALKRKKASDRAYFISFEHSLLEAPDGNRPMDNSLMQAMLAASAGGTGKPNYLNIFWKGYYKRCEGLMET